MKQFSKELGKVSVTPKGAWDSNITNERLDIVYDKRNNQAYIAKQNVPVGVDIDNREYWQPLNVSGYADNNFINLTTENENGTITAFESLDEAIAAIFPINRRAGATLSFYNLNFDRLDRQAEFELWQFNSTDLANWENKDYWNNIYYNWNVFVGWYIGVDALNNHVKIPTVGQYAYVGSNLNDALLYQCRTNGTWTNTGIKVRNYISVVVSGNITIGENGNWFSDGKDTGIPATPAVDEQLDDIIIQLQQHTTEISNLKKTDANLQDQITSNDSDITSLTAKHKSLSKTVQGIAATGGASTANNITYNNDTSGLNAENAQDAIDELQNSKIDKASILQELGVEEDKAMSQKAVSDELNNLSDTIGTKSSEESVILGQGLTGYIDATGTFQAQSGSAANRVYRVDNLSNIKSIYAKSYEDSADNKQFKHIAFYEESGNYIDGVDFSDGLVEHTIIVPSDASYAYVFTHNDSIKPTVNIIVGSTGVYAEIDSINEDIDVINTKIEDIENGTENPNTKIQSYSTYVRNPTNAGGETPIQIICRFKYGEVTSPSKLRVRDNEGNYYPCQWEDVSSVNPAVDFVNGRWSDGSLRSGKLWIIANLPANKLSAFYIDILQEDQNVVQTVFYDASRLYCSKKSFILNTNGFNGSYYPCIMDNKTGSTINIHNSSDIKNKQITTEGNGVVYLDYIVRFHYKNLLFIEKYRMFYNGELYVHIYCTVLEDVSCYSIHIDYYTSDRELSYVNNTVTYVKYRDSNVQTLVSLISVSMDNLRAGNYSVLPSYFSVINSHFYTGFRANGDTEIFKKGLSVSFYFKEANSPMDNYHYLQYLEPTGCITETPYGFNKVKIKNICKSILLSTYVVMERMVGETNKTLICHNIPSVIMRGIEHYNGFKLTDSSKYFKADIKEILGSDVITLDIIKGQWNNSSIGFQHLNRFIPFAYNIWMYLEDDSEKEYYHNLLQCYGDFVSWVYETYNDIPLTKDNAANSNSLASGLLALSMAYKVTGDNKYKTLYTSVENTYMAEPYNIMGYMDNDTDGASVSLQRYLHYQAYSRFTYLLSKYVMQEDNYPNLDVASTILMGIDSDGNPLDQEYTCSDSRRGSVQTLAYIIGILCGTPELDYQSQLGEICVERLKECFNGNNTEKFPINGFLNKGNTALSDLVIVNGILLQIATMI